MSATLSARRRLAEARAERYVQAAGLAGVPATRTYTIGQQQVMIGAEGTDRLLVVVRGSAAGRTRVWARCWPKGCGEPVGSVKVREIPRWIQEHAATEA